MQLGVDGDRLQIGLAAPALAAPVQRAAVLLAVDGGGNGALAHDGHAQFMLFLDAFLVNAGTGAQGIRVVHVGAGQGGSARDGARAVGIFPARLRKRLERDIAVVQIEKRAHLLDVIGDEGVGNPKAKRGGDLQLLRLAALRAQVGEFIIDPARGAMAEHGGDIVEKFGRFVDHDLGVVRMAASQRLRCSLAAHPDHVERRAMHGAGAAKTHLRRLRRADADRGHVVFGKIGPVPEHRFVAQLAQAPAYCLRVRVVVYCDDQDVQGRPAG